MGFGRVICVALPFILTLASLAALLVAGLAGVADKNLYMFEVNTTNLSISPDDVSSLLSSRQSFGIFHDPNLLNASAAADAIKSGDNITAADLGLYNLYQVGLWGYCAVAQDGSHSCTKPAFNWAEGALNNSQNGSNTIATVSGQTIALPKDITDAMSAFSTITKWTEVVFIIAYICLVVELFLGIFANCSRAFSCITFIVAIVASVAVGAAAGLATAMSAIVVGAVEGTAKWYGVEATLDTQFLAAVWISVLFAVAAGFFWLFTICCCAPDHHARRNRRTGPGPRTDEGEKLMPTGAYQPLHEPEQQGFATNQYNYAPQYGAPRYPSGAPRSDLAYEPYSHANV